MGNEAEIKARLEFDGDEGVRDFSDTCSEIERRADASGARLTMAVGRIAAAGALLVVAGAAKIAQSSMAAAAALDDTAKQAGVAVERYQTLTAGLNRLGLAPKQADDALRSLNNTLGEVQSGSAAKGAAAALDRMGVRARILSGEIDTADELLDAVATSSKKFGTEAQYTAAMVDILGKSVGTDLASALQDGGVALRQQEADVRAAGNVIAEEYVEALVKAQNQVDDFTRATTNRMVIWSGAIISEFQRVARNIEIFQEGSKRDGEEYFGGLIVTRESMPKGGRGGGRSSVGSAFRYQADREASSGVLGATAVEAAKAEEERLKREKAARRELAAEERGHEKALRAAEKAREAALQKENDLIRRQGEAMQDLVDIATRLRGNFADDFDDRKSDLFGRFNRQTDVTTDVGTDVLQDIATREIEAAFGNTTDEFQKDGLIAVQAIAQAFGGKVGGEVNKIAGVFRGLATGDFTSVGGPAAGALTLIGQDKETRRALKETFGPIVDEVGNGLADIAKDLGLGDAKGLGGAAIAGFGIGSAIGGNMESGIGGAAGGMAGKALGAATGIPGMDIVGQAVGSLLGSAIGGLFAQPKKGSVTLGSSGGEFTVGAATGNSASRREAATTLGGGLADSLNNIAKLLGAGVGSFAVSVGQRDGVFSVDPTGRGMVSKKYGAIQFDSAEEALRYALQDVIADGGFTGLSATQMNALRNGSSLEKGIDDALLIQSVAKRLAALDDPMGAAIDALDDEFEGLRETLIRNGATVAELADAERLYGEERKRLVEAQLATLKDFQSSLNVGSNSPLSLTDQRRAAESAFSQFEADILAGKDIDQGGFTKAAQELLDVERQISGGTAGFFDQFNRVQGLTSRAIADLENVSAIREGPFAQKTADATTKTAETAAAQLNATNKLSEQNAQIIALLQAMTGFSGGYNDAASRGFVRAV